MTAYEMIDGQYYLQGSDEHLAALAVSEESQAKEYPMYDLGRFLGSFLRANEVDPTIVPKVVVLSAHQIK